MVSAFARSVAAHVKALMEPNAQEWDPADAKVGRAAAAGGACVATGERRIVSWTDRRGARMPGPLPALGAQQGHSRQAGRQPSAGADVRCCRLATVRTSLAAPCIPLIPSLPPAMLQVEREHEKRLRAEQEAKRQAERLAKARAREAALAARLAAQAAAAAAPATLQQQAGSVSASGGDAKPEAAAPASAATPVAPPAPASTPVVPAAAASDAAADAEEDGGGRKRRRRGGGAVDYVALNKQLEAEAAARRVGGDAS